MSRNDPSEPIGPNAVINARRTRYVALTLGVVALIAVSAIGILVSTQAILCSTTRSEAVFSADQRYDAWIESQTCSLIGDDSTRVRVDRVSLANALPWYQPTTVLRIPRSTNDVSVAWDDAGTLHVMVSNEDLEHATTRALTWNDVSIVYIAPTSD